MKNAEYCLPDNTILRYVDHGPPGGIPLLLLHGYSDSAFSFSRVLPLLPSDLRAIALHQRGHGDSDRPPGPYTIDRFARDAIALMDGLRLESAFLTGHSLGSFVARRAAELAPARVRALVLIAAADSARNDGMFGLANAVLGLKDPVDRRFIREFQWSTIHRPVPQDFMDRVVEESQKVPARVWKDAMAGLLEAEPIAPSPCPTLILGGDCDSVFSVREQQALARHIPHAEIQIYSQVGHTPHWEIPEQFVADVVGFLRRNGLIASQTREE